MTIPLTVGLSFLTEHVSMRLLIDVKIMILDPDISR